MRGNLYFTIELVSLAGEKGVFHVFLLEARKLSLDQDISNTDFQYSPQIITIFSHYKHEKFFSQLHHDGYNALALLMEQMLLAS